MKKWVRYTYYRKRVTLLDKVVAPDSGCPRHFESLARDTASQGTRTMKIRYIQEMRSGNSRLHRVVGQEVKGSNSVNFQK
jgi:hypothetical protein